MRFLRLHDELYDVWSLHLRADLQLAVRGHGLGTPHGVSSPCKSALAVFLAEAEPYAFASRS